jgi:hypothetical protein
MAQFETGYPPFRSGDNQQAYDLGCQLLDLQDRLLVKHKNKRVRAMLQLDMPRQETELFWVNFALREAVHNTGALTQEQYIQVLCHVARWNWRLEFLATELGL